MISKGDLITSSKPFAFALCTEEREKRCDQCFKTLKVKIPCYKCFNVMFCSRKCEMDSMEERNHSHECRILANRPLLNMARIIARVIKKIEQNDSNQVEVIGSYRREWDCLMDHYDNIVKDVSVMYGFDAILMDLELIFADKLPDIKYVISIYGKILINSFAVQDEFMRQIGRAVYIGPSIFDHSCTPSAAFMFIGTTIYVKAIKDMLTDDVKEVRISYIDEFETTRERQRQLQCSYYFECDCERCVTHSQQPSAIDIKEDETLRSIYDKLDKLSDDGHYLYRFDSSGRTFKDMRLHESSFKNENDLMAQLVSQLRKEVMSLRSVLEVKIADFIAILEKDINLFLRIINIYRSYYGQYHPRLALRLYIAAKNADKYPILKKQLLTEAQSIAYLITPNFKQLDKRTNCSDERMGRTINKCFDKRLLSDSVSNSTLLYLIETELNERQKFNYYTININKFSEHKQRSRSYINGYQRSKNNQTYYRKYLY